MSSRSPSSVDIEKANSCNHAIKSIIDPQSELDKIIYSAIDRQLLRSGNDYGIERLLEDEWVANKIKKKISKIQKKRKVKKVRSLAQDIYLLANSEPGFFRSLWEQPLSKSGFKKKHDKLIFKQWENALLTNDILQATKKLNLLKDPQNTFHLSSTTSDIKETMKGLLYFSFIFTPKINVLKNKRFSKEMMDKVFNQYVKSNYDFDTIKPILIEHWGKRAKVDIAFDSLRTTFMFVTIPTILYFVSVDVIPWAINDLPIIVEKIPDMLDRMYEYTIPKLMEEYNLYELDEADRKEMEEELINTYKEAIFAFKGKYPSEDSKGLLKKKKYFSSISDLNLQLEYQAAFDK